jgi:uncharacterized protein (UPF0332 family)
VAGCNCIRHSTNKWLIMKQKYSDKLRESFKIKGEDECWHRAERCAKHLLTAISFRETSEVTQLYTGSLILPPIGFYYSLFHMGIAMLYIEYSTSIDSLKGMKHSKLQNLIRSKLVNTGLLSEDYVRLLAILKRLREHTNYAFGEYSYDFMQEVSELYELTGSAFDMAISVIDSISYEARSVFDFKSRIRTYIGNSKGDDLIQTYLSSYEQERVLGYLLQNDLTN